MALSDRIRTGRRPALILLGALVAALLAVDAARPGTRPVAAAQADGVRALIDIPYRAEPTLALDVYRRLGATGRAPAVVVVHGGSWRMGAKRRMSTVSRALARHGFVVFNVDYRLATRERPGVRRQQQDLRAALRWIRGNAARFDVDPRRIGALGSSAGGHLVSLLATRGTGPLTDGTRIRAAAAWSAPFDLASFRHRWLGSAIETFLGCMGFDCGPERRAASPTEHVSPDDPPMLIANSRDEVIPSSQALAMAEQLAAAGVGHRLRLLAGSRHGIEYARAMLPATIAFLERTLRPRRAR